MKNTTAYLLPAALMGGRVSPAGYKLLECESVHIVSSADAMQYFGFGN